MSIVKDLTMIRMTAPTLSAQRDLRRILQTQNGMESVRRETSIVSLVDRGLCQERSR
jgi:hypothetical protein